MRIVDQHRKLGRDILSGQISSQKNDKQKDEEYQDTADPIVYQWNKGKFFQIMGSKAHKEKDDHKTIPDGKTHITSGMPHRIDRFNKNRDQKKKEQKLLKDVRWLKLKNKK